jgi:AAA domain-containing protein
MLDKDQLLESDGSGHDEQPMSAESGIRGACIRPIEAAYLPQTHPLYRDNALNDALPPMRSDQDWIVQLLNAPEFDESQRQLDSCTRSYFVSQLKHLFIPTAQHVKLARRFDQLIRWGYESRRPSSPERALLLQRTYAKAQAAGKAVKVSYNDVQPICTFSLIGCSGVGKSTSVEHILSSYPQCIHHPKHHFTQLVWLKVECAKDGSVKELALSILRAFDKVLGTNYAPERESRVTAAVLTQRVNHLAVAHHLGILVLDEMQNLSVKKSGGREEMLNWFQELVNELKLPVALLGTYKARSVLQLDMRHARRVTVNGSENWDPLKNNGEFDFLVSKLWRYQWLRNCTPLSEEMKLAIYDETQGIRAFMVDMFLVAQLHALWKGEETLTPELFRTVARTEFSAVQPMLHALRSRDPNRIRRFADLVSFDVDESTERLSQLISARASAESPAASMQTTMVGQATARVQSALSLSAPEAKQLVMSAMQTSHRTANALTLAAIKLYSDSVESDAAPDETPND